MKKKKTANNTGKVIAIGAGVAAIGVMSYLLFGPAGKKNQKKLKGWMLKMKGEVMEKMEDAKEVTASVFENIVDEVGKKYKSLKNIDSAELAAEIASLKKGWKAVVSKSKKTIGKGGRKVKAVVKKTARKSLTKLTKKK
jgi:malic enzyme